MHDPDRHALNTRIVDVARRFSHLQEGSLLLVYVWQPVAETRVISRTSDEAHAAYVESSMRRASEDLTAFANTFDDRLVGTRLELRRGQVDDAILELIVAEGIDVLVMGTMGRTGLARHVLGNTAERVLERFPCSIVTVKPS
jgi:nucleotide-binding universal stress UspA family protein